MKEKMEEKMKEKMEEKMEDKMTTDDEIIRFATGKKHIRTDSLLYMTTSIAIDTARTDERKKFDLHGKLEGIIHISDKEIRYEMFSKYKKEIEEIT